MQGDPDVLRLLNEQLTSELTAINQYFLHSKMQDNWGFTELAAHTRAESFDEMRHAEEITDRILLLDGLPNYQRIGSLRIGQTLREQFEADLAIEYDVLNRLKPADRGPHHCRVRTAATNSAVCNGRDRTGAASQRALTDPLTDRCHPTRHGVGLTAADKIDHLPRTTP